MGPAEMWEGLSVWKFDPSLAVAEGEGSVVGWGGKVGAYHEKAFRVQVFCFLCEIL